MLPLDAKRVTWSIRPRWSPCCVACPRASEASRIAGRRRRASSIVKGVAEEGRVAWMIARTASGEMAVS